VLTSRVCISAYDWLNYSTEIRKEELLWKRKESRREFRKENFFGIPKSSDIGRSLENVFGKFPECGPWSQSPFSWLFPGSSALRPL